jgi:NADH-quinone oxidoreductase subunit J
VAEGFRSAYLHLGGPPAGSPHAIGSALFRAWVLPFEVLSVLLLASLIGAVVLTRPAPAGNPARETTGSG